MTSEYYLGLDISTACTGYSIIDKDGALIDIGWFELSGLEGLHAKADFVEKKLRALPTPTGVFVEENVLGFRPGSSSAHVIITLAKFNALVSHLCWTIWSIAPVSIVSISARKTVGLKVPKGDNVKIHVLEWAKSKIGASYTWPTKVMKAGPRKGAVILQPGCTDAADAYLLVNAGLKIKESQIII